MEKRLEHKCARVGRIVGLLCATLAALLPGGIVLKEFIYSLPGRLGASSGTKWPLLVGGIITLLVLYLVAALVGSNIGENICRDRRGYAGAIAGGIGVSFSTLAAGSLVAAACYAFGYALKDPLGEAFGLVLLTWLFGILPAILLGVLYGVLVRWYLTNIKCGSEA
jgi:hypothetical protein